MQTPGMHGDLCPGQTSGVLLGRLPRQGIPCQAQSQEGRMKPYIYLEMFSDAMAILLLVVGAAGIMIWWIL